MSLDDPALSQWLLLAGLSLAVFFGVLAIPSLASGMARHRRHRIERVRQRWSADPGAKRSGILRPQQREGLPGFILNLVPKPQLLKQRLARTGLKAGLTDYLLACAVCGLASFGVLEMLGPFSTVLNAAAGLAAAIMLPQQVVGTLIARRQKKITAAFSEAIDLMVRGLRSGLPITETIRSVGEEMSGPIAEEFKLINELQSLGQTLEQALQRAADRVDTAEFRFFVIALAVQRETGGNLAETLENLSAVLRDRFRMKMKIKALSAEPRASAAILGALPTIMWGILYLVNSGYALELFTDPRGHFMIGFGVLSQAMGIGVMARMIRFEI